MINSMAYEVMINKNITNETIRRGLVKTLNKVRFHPTAYDEFVLVLINKIADLYMEREDWKHTYEKLIEEWANQEDHEKKGKRHGKSN